MKIYILAEMPAHETAMIYGVYSSEEKATAAMADLVKECSSYYRNIEIIEEEVK